MTVYIQPFEEALHNGERLQVTIGVNKEAVRMLEGELAKGVPMQGTSGDALAEMGRRMHRAYSFVHDIHMQMRPQFDADAAQDDMATLRTLLKDARSYLVDPASGHDDGLLLADLIERIDAAVAPSTPTNAARPQTSDPTREQDGASPHVRLGKAAALVLAASRSPEHVREIAGQMLGRPVDAEDPPKSVAPHIVVSLPDGCNGHTANFVSEPVERDGDLVKLKCAERGKEYMIRWIASADLQSAIAAQVANAKAWEYRDEKEGVAVQSLDRFPPEKREQWTSERPLDAVPASLVGLGVEASDQAAAMASKPRMRP
ncbi:hypothetical protein K6L09_41595 [Burkholderia cepacia]